MSTLAQRVLDHVLVETTDRHRADVSIFRWHVRGGGLYQLRLRGVLPLWLVNTINRRRA